MINKITIASRESKLALWQTDFVKNKIEQELDLSCDILTMKTKGDIVLNKPLSQIGGKALFMKELEIAMQNNQADMAVHSLKDVPYELPQGFCLTTFLERDDPRDAFVSNTYQTIDDLPLNAVIGTSSLRRKTQLLNYRSDLIIKDLRGNVQTRLSKLDNNDFDAIILASAGLIRLNLKNRISQYIPTSICLPAVGQGIVTIEAFEQNKELVSKLSQLNNEHSYRSAIAERAFNQELQGGCHVAIAAHATVYDDKIILEAMVSNSEGTKILRKSDQGIDAHTLGIGLAKKMIADGAKEILGI